MIEIKTKQSAGFPLDIFEPEIAQSFQDLAKYYSIPIDYVASSALWTISSLSGNMYDVPELPMKIILYSMLLGPSSLGKSVAFRVVCEDIIKTREIETYAKFQTKLADWNERNDIYKKTKSGESAEPPGPVPRRKIRIITSATTEAIIHYATFNPAGFGMYFDEGKAMYSGGAYKKENNSVDFWNKAYNGDMFNELRVEQERERFVINPAISVLAGMQSERITEMFSKDTRESGLINRFLFTSSDYIELNEDVDYFGEKKGICNEWKSIVSTLYDRGCEFFIEEGSPFNPVKRIYFNPDGKIAFKKAAKRLTAQANELIRGLKEGDGTKNIIAYWGKLFTYFKRFMPILAIIRDQDHPEINSVIVDQAEKLYYYYRDQARKVLSGIINQEQTDLNENESLLLNNLPDRFTASEAELIADSLKFSKSYFYNTYRRKYSKGFLIKKEGIYTKIL